MFLIREVDVIFEGLVDGKLKDLPYPLDDILAIFGSVDDPADVLLEGIGTALAFIETTLTVDQEDLLDHSEDVEQELPLGVGACPAD